MGILQCKNLPQAPSLGLPGETAARSAALAGRGSNFLMFLGFSPGSGQWRGLDQERVQPDEEHHVEDEAANHGNHIVAL